jgi:arylsulfatase A-like enzyme
MVQNLDENIGRLVEALEAEGIMDDTLLVFTSDNGGLATAEGSPTCNAPLSEGKGWMYEGGTREPMIVCWPGQVPADSFCDVPVTSVDFFPTFCEVAGLDVPPQARIEGVSILDLFKGGGRLDREAIYWHYPHYANQGGRPGCSVRSGDWKLIEFFEDNHVELYNLREDVSEENDVSADQPDLVKRLRTMLHEWLEKVDAKIPEPNPDWP